MEAAAFPRIDWVGALDVSHFTGREGELAELSHWIVQEHCRLVAILGLGGIGKSALVSLLGKQLAPQFDAVLWRSLRDAPSCEELVADCLTFFSETPPTEFPPLLEPRINQLIGRLQERRCLLVLDNLETVLEEGDLEGNYRPGFQGYGRLIERLGESAHRSCVVLTSREKPREIEAAEGLHGPVRSLRLLGLSQEAAHSLLADKDLRGASSAWQQLIASYAGNPLALKIMGQAIVDLFAGEIVPFLQSGELIFNGIRMVLRQQVARLTLLEQMLLTWLAVAREWTSLDALLSLLAPRPTRGRVLEALEALWRRSLIERGEGGSFTLQSVVMEYVTDALIEQLSEEIRTMALDHLHRYALEQAQRERLCARESGAFTGASTRGAAASRTRLGHARRGAVPLAAQAHAHGRRQQPGLWPGQCDRSAQGAARRPARPGPLTARHSGGVLARGRDARHDACRGLYA